MPDCKAHRPNRAHKPNRLNRAHRLNKQNRPNRPNRPNRADRATGRRFDPGITSKRQPEGDNLKGAVNRGWINRTANNLITTICQDTKVKKAP